VVCEKEVLYRLGYIEWHVQEGEAAKCSMSASPARSGEAEVKAVAGACHRVCWQGVAKCSRTPKKEDR